MPSASGVGTMIAITRGVVAAVLLAGAVAGAAAFPRFFAGPGGGETPSFALPGAAAQPAIVRAPALPAPHVAPTVPIVVTPLVLHPAQAVAPLRPKPRPIVIRRVTPPAPAKPAAPAPTPTRAPASATASSAPVVIAAPAAPVMRPAPITPPAPDTNGNGKAKGHHKQPDRVAADVPAQPVATAPLGSDHGPPAQAPPRPDRGDGGPVRPVETPDTAAAPPGHGHGPSPWTHGGGQGH